MFDEEMMTVRQDRQRIFADALSPCSVVTRSIVGRHTGSIESGSGSPVCM